MVIKLGFRFLNNRSAQSAQLTIYSVSGRRVRRVDVDARAGTNAYRWDLRDEAGDLVANGVYLFLLEITDFSGERITVPLERVALTR